MRQGIKLQKTGVYLNEHLTKKNADIAKEARSLRKDDKIKATWTRNCKIFIRLNGATPEDEKVLVVREIENWSSTSDAQYEESLRTLNQVQNYPLFYGID
ncbi:hypothetical protein AAFF_G00266140 [Aldrovandia affinis]|uniref:Uncharacterized protein n=1 Tax=Aldrovandia affinis TaxID=143900 RepID=A0AAD7W2N3_9TELE|nr:hypothetical protein AAFF_G00266140 [Aldrovandia affinis]